MGAAMRFSHGAAALFLGLGVAVLADTVQAQEHAEHGRARPSQPVAWSVLPLLQSQGRPGERGAVAFRVAGMAEAELRVFAPENPGQSVTMEEQGEKWQAAALPGSQGGYHWLLAERGEAGKILRAGTIWSFPGKGTSPQALLQTPLAGLDLRPVRVPDKGAFRENSSWSFRVTWDGLPLPGRDVLLETENGSRQRFVSGSDGVVDVLFPGDYPADAIDPALGAVRTRKGYLLSVAHEHEGVHHLTTFSQFYSPALLRERSLLWGAVFAGVGALLAAPLIRRREKKYA